MRNESLRSGIVDFQNNQRADSEFSGNGSIPEAIGKEESADGGDGRLAQIETHTNRLLSLLNELRSVTHRACDAALKEAECADRIEESMETEITGLRGELKEKEESVRAREIAIARLEETSQAKFAELEGQIQEKESQLKNRDIQWHYLTSEKDQLVNRLNEAELAVKQAESRARQFTERLETELTGLRLQITKREESLAARELALSRFEGDLRTSIQNLQLRLQEGEARLASQENELKQKQAVIQAAAVREAEIGKLIQRLSLECEKLSAELCDKTLMIAQLEDKTRHSANGKVWKKVLNMVQQEPLQQELGALKQN